MDASMGPLGGHPDPRTGPAKGAPPKDIDAYAAPFPQEVRDILEKVRATIREAAPEAEEAIRYGIPTFVLNGTLVHFAAFKRHIGFYPTPSGIARFGEELSAYPSSKGAVQFPLDGPMPYDLIRDIVRFRAQENLERAGAKGKRGGLRGAPPPAPREGGLR